MRYNFFKLLAVCCAFVCLSSCDQAAIVVTRQKEDSGLCNSSKPEEVLTMPSNYSWSGIVIGASTLDDVVTMLGTPKTIKAWGELEGEPAVCRYIYDVPIIWIVGDKVIGIEFATSGKHAPDLPLPQTLEDIKHLYDYPSVVGWSSLNDPNYRAVVWTEEGVKIEILPSMNNRVFSIFYFSPMSLNDFLDSRLSGLVLNSRPTNTDIIDTLPQDPFNWEEN